MNAQIQETRVTVPDSIVQIWNQKRKRGDIARLIASTQLSKPTLITALNKHRASKTTILKISEFFAQAQEVDFEKQALEILNKKQ